MGHSIKLIFFQNVPLIMLKNFKHDQIFLKNKFQGLKRQLSGKISDKWKKMTFLNDVIHKNIFQNVSLMM